jgi:hypothetical protein
LGQNRELRGDGVWNWSLPAWAGRLPDGRTYNTCPSAGVCRLACYALNGTYRFPDVRARHLANLLYVLDDLAGWQWQMLEEVAHRRHQGGWVRIHDAGDFFSDPYTTAWLEIAEMRPHTRFYAYTKEVGRFKRLVEGQAPPNFLWVYSYGGREDHLIDPDRDRTADVFPDTESMWEQGYADNSASDLLAVTGPARVGIPANNIPHFRKRQGVWSFRTWQQETEAARARRRAGASP